jgi:hypothetical protein
MKRFTLFIALLFATTLSAQVYKNSKFWSVAMNVGGHGFHSHINTNSIKFYQPAHVHLNAGYKFNHIYGIRPSINYHNNRRNDNPNAHYLNASLDFTVDFNQMGTYGFREKKWEFSSVGYMGFGFSTMWTDRLIEGDPYLEGQDDMMSFTIGITPRMRITDRMLLNFDMAYTVHHMQDWTFDWDARKDRGFGGGFLRFGVGLTYEFVK